MALPYNMGAVTFLDQAHRFASGVGPSLHPACGMPRPECRYCERTLSDQVGGDPDVVRAHPGGAQCRLCLRVTAGDPLSFKTEEQKQEEEAKAKKDDESRAK